MNFAPLDGEPAAEREDVGHLHDSAAADVPRHLLRRLIAVAASVAFIALLAYGLVAKAPDDSIDQALADGRPATAPSFDLPLLHEGDLPAPLAARLESALADGRLALGELAGSPVVLNFWASWCVPCREEAPLLARSWERWGPDGVVFLGLNMQDLTADARNFIGEFESNYPNVRDQTDDVATEWGVTGIPETFFLTDEGKVVNHVIGVVSPQQMRAGIAAARLRSPSAPLSGGSQRPTR